LVLEVVVVIVLLLDPEVILFVALLVVVLVVFVALVVFVVFVEFVAFDKVFCPIFVSRYEKSGALKDERNFVLRQLEKQIKTRTKIKEENFINKFVICL